MMRVTLWANPRRTDVRTSCWARRASNTSASGDAPAASSRRVPYEAGPTTVTRVPMGARGHTLAASEMRISTHPLLWGKP